MKVALIILGIVFFLAVSFLLVDCSCGTTRFFECSVTGHHYVEPWTEISQSVDSDGNSTVSTIQHPEEFHILCEESDGTLTFDCPTSRQDYYQITNGEPVTVSTRQGKWTKGQYLPSIVR